MNRTPHRDAADPEDCFDHRATVYTSTSEMLDVVGPFVQTGLAKDNRVVLVMSDRHMRTTRATLGAAFDKVEVIRAEEVYARPAKAYADYCAMLDAHTRSSAQPIRIIAEQHLVGRNPKEIAELRRIESACNATFTFAKARVLCLYDAETAPATAINGVGITHPTVLTDGTARSSPAYTDPSRYLLDELRATRLPAPPAHAARLDPVESGRQARQFTATHAERLGVHGDTLDKLAMAATEVVTNALVNAVGVRQYLWRDADHVVCQVGDAGYGLTDGLSGYRPPYRNPRGSGRLWAARLLCETLEIATGDLGTTVRMTIKHHPADSATAGTKHGG